VTSSTGLKLSAWRSSWHLTALQRSARSMQRCWRWLGSMQRPAHTTSRWDAVTAAMLACLLEFTVHALSTSKDEFIVFMAPVQLHMHQYKRAALG
jgi:hypothetical protein